MYSILTLTFSLLLLSFLHSNPEDLSEVPGGFITDINPNSLQEVTNALVEQSVRGSTPLTKYQFERVGYFCVDYDSKDDKVKLMFCSGHLFWSSHLTNLVDLS